MTRKQQWYLVGGIVAFISAGVTAATFLVGDHLMRVQVGSAAPDFAANTLDASPTTRTLADYQGRVILLNVWATWCEPCKEEMPSMERLHREYSDRGLSVVAVSIDFPGSEKRIRDFEAEYGITFDILYDPEGNIQKSYQTVGVPETFIIDRKGMLVRKVWRAQDWASLANRALMVQLLDAGSEE
jgi:peroxiredoxin